MQTKFENSFYEHVLDKVPDAVYVCNSNGEVKYANQILCDFIGASWDELANLNWMKFAGPDIHPVRGDWLERMQNNPHQFYESVFKLKRHDGELRRCLNRVVPIVSLTTASSSETDTLYVGCSTDIEDQIKQEEQREVEQTLIETIFEQLPIGLYVLDSDLKPVIFNRKLKELWTDVMKKEGVATDTETNMINWAAKSINLPYEKWPVVQTIKEGKVITDFLVKGENTLMVNTSPIYDKNNSIRYGIAVVQDLTKEILAETEKNLAIEREKATKELTHNKMEFVMNMSHEIRTPLHGILGMTEIMSNEMTDVKQLEDLDKIKNAADNLLTIVDAILDVSKMETDAVKLECVEFDLRKLVTDIRNLFQPSFTNKNITFTLTVPDTFEIPQMVKSDPIRVRQCLTNILSNAVKFTPSGGNIFVRVYKTKDISDEIMQVCFEIEDTGIGMSQETIRNLFQSFVQGDSSTTKNYSGIGLGLSITKKLITLLNDGLSEDIKVESSLGKGSTFYIYINFTRLKKTCLFEDAFSTMSGEKSGEKSEHAPLVTESTTTTTEPTKSTPRFNRQMLNSHKPSFDELEIDEQSPQPLHHKQPQEPHEQQEQQHEQQQEQHEQQQFDPKQINILLVEDNDLNRMIATRMLKKHGFNVYSAINGYEAIKMIDNEDIYDVILMDIQMPVMDGIEATIELRNKGYKKIIIAQTANASSDDRERSLKIGMDDHIRKPFDMNVVLEKIRSHYLRFMKEKQKETIR